jgi:hypothetical protein
VDELDDPIDHQIREREREITAKLAWRENVDK